MTKMIKLSLVAAVAVASFATAASANGHENEVKFSGFVSYDMEKVTNKNDDEEAKSDIDVSLTAVMPVNDMISATLHLDESSDEDTDGDRTGTSIDLMPEVDKIYFTYKNDGLTADFGRVGSTPLTDGVGADGVKVAKNFGAVSVGGGYLYSTERGSDEVAYLNVGGKVAPVSYGLTLANVMDSDKSTRASEGDNSATAMAINLGANVGMFSVALNHASRTGMKNAAVEAVTAVAFNDNGTNTDTDDTAAVAGVAASAATDADDQSQTALTVSANFGVVNAQVKYAMNDKKGGEVLLDESDVAASNISIAALDLSGLGDASAVLVKVGMNFDAKNSGYIAYAASDVEGTDMNQAVIKLAYSHKMSKNFTLGGDYEINTYDASSNDKEQLTLGAKYSF